MQFIPSSWRAYGVDANKDGKKDPYNPVDAIFAAGRYLKAAGAEKDLRRAIFAYNHADWYVDSVMLRAKLITGVPADLVGSLTGLTEGRFPVYARARYADDLAEAEATKRVKKGQNAANVVTSKDDRSSIDVFARQGSPVVAVNDGVIKKIGRVASKLGRYMQLQDVYGNTYTYSGLGSVSKFYPVPKDDIQAETKGKSAKAIKANDPKDPKPTGPASQGRQADTSDKPRTKANAARPRPRTSTTPSAWTDGRRPAEHRRLGPGQAAPVRPPRHAGRARERRPRADAGRRGPPRRQGLRGVQELRPPLRPERQGRPPQAAAKGRPGDRRHAAGPGRARPRTARART